MSFGHGATVLIYPVSVSELDRKGPAKSFGDPVSFTMREPPEDGSPMYSCVTSITVTQVLGQPPAIVVALDLPFDLGHSLLETDLLNMGNKVEVRLHSTTSEGAPSPPFTGYIQTPEIEDGDDGITVSIQAVAIGIYGAQMSAKRQSYAGMTPRQIIKKHAVEDMLFDDVEFISQTRPSPLDAAAGKDDQFYVNTSASLLEFVEKIAHQCKCEITYRTGEENGQVRNVMVLTERVVLLAKRSTRMFVKGNGKTAFSEGGFPGWGDVDASKIHFLTGGFKTEGTLTWAAGMTRPPVYGLIDATKKIVTDAVVPVDAEVPSQGEKTDAEETKEEKKARTTRRGAQPNVKHVAATDKAKEEAESDIERKKFEGTGGIKGSFTCLGIPDIAVGEIVQLVGVGSRFEVEAGYMLMGFTHEMSTDDFNTRIDVTSSGVPAYMNAPKAKTVVPPSPPSTGDDVTFKKQAP